VVIVTTSIFCLPVPPSFATVEISPARVDPAGSLGQRALGIFNARRAADTAHILRAK
jgi:hypothetical protein